MYAIATLAGLLLLTGSSVYAQTNTHTQYPADECGPDVLVDDFAVSNRGVLPFPGETAVRDLNLLKADYGKNMYPDMLTYTINTAQKRCEIIAGKNGEPQPAGDNFFFSKFDAEACFDLTTFYAVAFDLLAPVGSDFTMCLTQKAKDCMDREPGNSDSTYIPITKYITPNNKSQTVVVPWVDFAPKSNGNGTFDFTHLKDWTLNKFTPTGAYFEITNIRLIRACKNNGPYGDSKVASPSVAAVVNATRGSSTSASLSSQATATGTGTTMDQRSSGFQNSWGPAAAAAAGVGAVLALV